MRAGVHHDDAVAGAQQEFRLTDDSNAVVGDAVEDENPVAIGIFRADFPAAEKRSIGSLHVEVLASSAGGGEARVGSRMRSGVSSREWGGGTREQRPSGYSSQERGKSNRIRAMRIRRRRMEPL